MSALERVARRIGMEPSDTNGYWLDPPRREAYTGTANLRAYLLTGDRPLRVMVEYQMDVGLDVRGDWAASAGPLDEEFCAEHVAHAPTPAAAIIALAERIEGEGRE